MKKLYLIFFILTLNISSLEAEVLVSLSGAASEEPHKTAYRWSNSSYVGYAWATKAGVVNPDPKSFREVLPGDTDDAGLGGVSYAGISMSRNICHWLALGFGYEIYNSFNYLSYHLVKDFVIPVSGVEVLNTNFIRSFSITHQSAIFSGYIDFPKNWQIVQGIFTITPVLGAGVGFGMNKMLNFQVLALSSGASPYSQLSTLGFNNMKTSLAWFVNFGIGFKPKNTTATFGFGYRYYVGGKFATSPQYILNDPINAGTIVNLAPWTGTLKTNQLKIFLDFDF